MMTHLARIISFLLLLTFTASAADTVSNIIEKFRIVNDEIVAEGSIVADSEIIVFLDLAQDKIVALQNYFPQKHDIIFAEDTFTYQLPVTFKRMDGVAVHATKEKSQWVGALENELFIIDTTAYMWFLRWDHQDTARIYLKGDFFPEDTVRVFYFGDLPDLTATTDTCFLPTNLQSLLLDEATAYFYQHTRNYILQKEMQARTRLDMGVFRQVEQ